MFSCFYVYESKKKRPRNTKEMKTKPKRLKLLFAIICNNLVKQEKKWLNFICIQLRIHIKRTSKWRRDNACIYVVYGEVRAEWRIAHCICPTTATLLFQFICQKWSVPIVPSAVTSSSSSLSFLSSAQRNRLPFFLLAAEMEFLFRSNSPRLRGLFSFYFYETKINFISFRFIV